MIDWAKNKLDRTFEAGKASTKGFIGSRLNSAVGGVKDSIESTAGLVKSTFSEEKSEGTAGVLGVIKETAATVKNTIFGENTGILNFKNSRLNPFNREGFLNPFKYARRAAAGTTEIAADAVGGIVSVVSERIGNTVKGIIRGGSRSIGGLMFGDYGYLMDYEASKTDAGNKVMDKAEQALKPSKSE
ncbi:hypothetical protein GF366_00615 [Candidatus Peregrinibacteria bacterium]|nr:hypothetical protein [Candidatus Peregrinibacteria bacterium]